MSANLALFDGYSDFNGNDGCDGFSPNFPLIHPKDEAEQRKYLIYFDIIAWFLHFVNSFDEF